jgi:hypothetical protein
MLYQKVLKSDSTILAELKEIAPTITSVDPSGDDLILESSQALTQAEKDNVAAYNRWTIGEI